VLFAAMAVLWGVPYFFIKIAVAELPPVTLVAARTAIAAAVLLPVALWRGDLRQLRGRLPAVVGLMLLEVTIPFVLISAGEQRIASSLTGLLIASLPMMIALLALRLDASERVDRLQLLGLCLGLAGVAALLGLDVGRDGAQLLGAAMVLLATLMYAFGVLLVKHSFSDVSPIGPATAAVALNTLVLAPFALASAPHRVPSPQVMLALLGLGLLCTAVAFLVYFALIVEAGAGRATVITYVNPAIAVALGVAVLGERLTPVTIAGFVLVIAGSWLSTRGPRPPTETPSPTLPARGREVTNVEGSGTQALEGQLDQA
jgi:drug/metabolite transporter (DMT)-like permease